MHYDNALLILQVFKCIWARLVCRAVSVSRAARTPATQYVRTLTMDILSLQCYDKQQVYAGMLCFDYGI